MASSNFPKNNKNMVIVISGPTGVGKSDVAAEICAQHRGMVVSADSVQAYRGVQIGANKPTTEERERTPHLLIDVVDSWEQYNAADWREDALACISQLIETKTDEDTKRTPRQIAMEKEIKEARARKGLTESTTCLPLVVGGTMFYVQWLVHGRPDVAQPSKEAVRKASDTIKIYQDKGEAGWQEGIEFLSALNPIFKTRAEKISAMDWYRLRRTMEIAFTVLDQDDPTLIDSLYSGEREGGLESLGYDVRCFFLCPDDRMLHTSIVDRRCEDMILRGLLEETTRLVETDSLPDMAARAIGYRQVLDYLQRDDPKEQDREAFEAFLKDFSTATRRYAKKQMQWFRKDSKFAFIPVPLNKTKEERIKSAVGTIMDLSTMSRETFEEELMEKTSSDTIPISAKTKLANEEQGKMMKFYQPQRYLLLRGSEEYDRVLALADECSNRVRNVSRQADLFVPKRAKLS